MDGYICYVQYSYKHYLGIGDGKHLINMIKSIHLSFEMFT